MVAIDERRRQATPDDAEHITDMGAHFAGSSSARSSHEIREKGRKGDWHRKECPFARKDERKKAQPMAGTTVTGR